MMLSQTHSGKGRKSTLEHIYPPSIICNCASCAERMFQLSLTTALYNSCSFEKPRICTLRAQMLPILEHGRQPVTVRTVDAGVTLSVCHFCFPCVSHFSSTCWKTFYFIKHAAIHMRVGGGGEDTDNKVSSMLFMRTFRNVYLHLVEE